MIATRSHGQDSTVRALVQYAQQVAPELHARLDRAAALVQAGAVEPSLTGIPLWYVRSQTARDGHYYVVTERERGPWHCTCPDFERRANWCKHALAAAISKRIGEGAAPPPPPVAFPEPRPRALDPDAPIGYELTERAYALLDGRGPSAA